MKITIESTPNNNFQIQADGSAEDDPIQVLKLLLNAARACRPSIPWEASSPWATQ